MLAPFFAQRDVNKEYEQRVQPKLDEYRRKTPRQRFEHVQTYNAFRNLVWVRACFPSALSASLSETVLTEGPCSCTQETFTDGAGVPNVKKFLPHGAPSLLPLCTTRLLWRALEY